MRKTLEKKEKGITLIALVITIIVLLILAGVAIATLTGENGILNKASTAQEKTIEAEEQEKIKLAYSEVIANKLDGTILGEISASDIVDALENQGVDTTKITVEPTGDGKTKVTFETGNEYTIDQNGKIGVITADSSSSSTNSSSGSGTSTANYQSITDLRDGDEVIYTYNGTQIPCTVLYDSTNENYSTYGVQIIADDTVGTVELGNGTGDYSEDATDFATAKASYNDAIGILNRAAAGYLNTDLATDARCVGSVSNSKNSRNTAKYTRDDEWFTSYNNQFEAGEEVYDEYNDETIVDQPNYTADKTQMDALGITDINRLYWLASRNVDADSYSTAFDVRYVYNDGYLFYSTLCYVNDGGYFYSDSYARGLRPVFTLKSDIKVVDGENNTKVLTK